MNKMIVAAAAVIALTFSSGAYAQRAGGVEVTNSPNATQIQGDTTIKANAKDTNTLAVGVGNVAATNIGAIGGSGVTQIQGTTDITASAKDTNTLAVGVANSATANVGTIGK